MLRDAGSLPNNLRIAAHAAALLGAIVARAAAADSLTQPSRSPTNNWASPPTTATHEPPIQAPASQAPASSAAGPRPIVWGKRMFFIPYQANPLDAPRIAKVTLWISQGDGPFAPLEQARPEVTGFAYHAANDGNYKFALQMADSAGRVWPPAPLKPLLEIEIDTKAPALRLSARPGPGGETIVEYEATDRQLDEQALKLEMQETPGGKWQALSLGSPVERAVGRVAGSLTVPRAPSDAAQTFRILAADRAGNDAAETATIEPSSNVLSLSQRKESASALLPQASPQLALEWPASNSLATAQNDDATGMQPDMGPSFDIRDAEQRNASTRTESPSALALHPTVASAGGKHEADPETEVGPAPWTSAVPGRLVSGRPTQLFGDPPVPQGEDPLANRSAPPARARSDIAPSSTLRPAGNGSSLAATDPPTAPSLLSAGPSSRQFSSTRSASEMEGEKPGDQGAPAVGGARLVNSRTFDVEYELDQVGPWGLAKVELWGTRDGGRTWQSFGVDPDNRSPARVTVDSPGDYGFLILVDAAGQMSSPPPRPGSRAELFVHVDLHPPSARLLGVAPADEQSERLLIRWEATDVNLELRPIGLFYSSYAAGPWATIATGLENSGSYEWPLMRHLPERFYLRLEVRDTAGNVTVDQLRDPVTLNRPQPAGRLRGVRAVAQ